MSNVKAVPEGYHSINTMLCLKGCSAAIEFYKKAFGAEQRLLMPGPNGAIMHCELAIGDSILMLTDAIQDPPTVSSIMMYCQDVDATFKRAVDAGATVKMAPANMFWGDRFGRVVDPYGITWGLATHVEDVPPAEMQKRMAAARPPGT